VLYAIVTIVRDLFLSIKFFFKVLTLEKRGGLKVASFDRSRFKLFTLRFSKIFVQAENYTQQSLFLLFEYNNIFIYGPLSVFRPVIFLSSCHISVVLSYSCHICGTLSYPLCFSNQTDKGGETEGLCRGRD
jgi:hypothetical protein